MDDLKDVPTEVVKALKITPVENITDVLKKLELL